MPKASKQQQQTTKEVFGRPGDLSACAEGAGTKGCSPSLVKSSLVRPPLIGADAACILRPVAALVVTALEPVTEARGMPGAKASAAAAQQARTIDRRNIVVVKVVVGGESSAAVVWRDCVLPAF